MANQKNEQGNFLFGEDLKKVALNTSVPVSYLRAGIHIVNEVDIEYTEDMAFSDELTLLEWERAVLKELMPEVPTMSLMYVLENDPEAYQMVQAELLSLRKKIAEIIAN